MDYSPKTQALIDRMCKVAERPDFILDKQKSEECILKTYDIFGLPRPKNISWGVDLEEKRFQDSARSAWSAWSASSALSARSALSAWSAWSASSAWSALSAWSASSAWSAWSASSAWSALSASSALSARSAWSALDYDFDWFVFAFEYRENPTEKPVNENDEKYLEYSELLLEAKEAGLGFRLEHEDTLYLIPTPINRLNSLNQWHSDTLPAIEWKGGQKIYYLNGVQFPEDLWKKVVSRKMPFNEILAIEDVDQRTQAMNYGDREEFLKYSKAELLDEYNKLDIEENPVNYKLYKIPKGEIFREDAYYCLFDCPSTRKKHMEGVEVSKTVSEAMSWAMSDDVVKVTPEEWRLMVPLVDEN